MKLHLFILFFIIGHFSLFTQNLHFEGRVLDFTTQEPLPSATVYLNNTTIGTTTDLDGNFILSVDGRYDKLIVSFVGYEVITHQIDMSALDKRYVPFLKCT